MMTRSLLYGASGARIGESVKFVSVPLGRQFGLMVPLAEKRMTRRFGDAAARAPRGANASRSGRASATPPAPTRNLRRLQAPDAKAIQRSAPAPAFHPAGGRAPGDGLFRHA